MLKLTGHAVRACTAGVLLLLLWLPATAGERLSNEQAEVAARIAAAFADSSVLFPARYDADVWLASADQRLAGFLPAADERLRLLAAVLSEAQRHDLDPELILAVIEVESRFDRFAISRVGAQGLMQVMPFWKAALGRNSDNLTAVETNIRYGAAILAHYLDKSSGDLIMALSRYNGTRELRYGQLPRLASAACSPASLPNMIAGPNEPPPPM